MARGKKKEDLSLEEKLKQALVPVDEQPYKIPENWCWTRLDYVADYKKGPFGSAITKAMFVPKTTNTYKVYEQGNAIRKTTQYGDYYISEEKYNELKGFAVAPGDLIVSCAGTIGETFQLPEGIEDGVINQALMRVRVSENINIQYYLYYFDDMLRQDITGNSKGSAIKNIPPFSVLKKFCFPLPPYNEQQKIVEQIHYYLRKLEEAREVIQNAIDGSELRKKAIFQAAIEGKLTSKWRDDNNVNRSEWKRCILSDVLDLITYGFTNPMPDAESGPWKITAKSIHDGIIDYGVSRKTTQKAFDEELTEKSKPILNDVLLTKDGSIGRVAVVDREGICINQSVALLRPNASILPGYLRDLLQSPEIQNIMELNSGGATIKHIYITRVDKMEIEVPSIEEQSEIEIQLHLFLERERAVKERLETILVQIDLMKKSILSKAFRGELGTNNSDEESSVELLKQILKEVNR